MNPLKMLQMKKAWDRFAVNHSKFPNFLQAVYQRGLSEGTVLEFKVTAPDGTELTSNIKLKQDDLDLFQDMKEMFQ